MAYLIKTIETYRLPNENAVETFLAETKKNPIFEVIKSVSTKKEVKEKGEVVETYYKVEITKAFNEEKFPDNEINIDYVRGEND